jgi:hypothetical protein
MSGDDDVGHGQNALSARCQGSGIDCGDRRIWAQVEREQVAGHYGCLAIVTMQPQCNIVCGVSGDVQDEAVGREVQRRGVAERETA